MPKNNKTDFPIGILPDGKPNVWKEGDPPFEPEIIEDEGDLDAGLAELKQTLAPGGKRK